jgi:hypothetical protein
MIHGRAALLYVFAIATPTLAATPRLDDYASGITIEAATTRPVVQLDVPDLVYRTVVNADLSDVRVFNADGIPVPHALCAAPTAQAPTISQQTLPAYRLQDLPETAAAGTRVEVETASGARVSVQGGRGGYSAARPPSAYVIDARDVTYELRAVQFDWRSPDGASEVHVSIQASDDLDRWRTLVAGSTLVQLEGGGQQLRRQRIGIPQARYEYLRVERTDHGPPLQIDGVTAESVTPAPTIEPAWFVAQATGATQNKTFEFDTARRAPIDHARLTPSHDNTSMQIALDSRPDAKAPWTTQWSGEVYSVVTDSERRVSPPAQFAATTDRHWRVRLTNDGEAFYQAPNLELGYRPTRLRLLAQGGGPYTLAFGSRRAEPAPMRACNGLLTNLSATELEASIGEGLLGAERTLGGDAAFRPLPKPTPLRQIALWSVLVVGVGALVAMALSLLRRLKPDGTG